MGRRGAWWVGCCRGVLGKRTWGFDLLEHLICIASTFVEDSSNSHYHRCLNTAPTFNTFNNPPSFHLNKKFYKPTSSLFRHTHIQEVSTTLFARTAQHNTSSPLHPTNYVEHHTYNFHQTQHCTAQASQTRVLTLDISLDP